MDIIRNYLRCSLMGEGNIVTDKIFESFEVINISASGALVKLPCELNPGTKCELTFDFKHEQALISFNTKGIIVRKEIKDGEFTYGIHFINLDEKNRVELDEFIRHNKKFNGKSSMNRFEDGDFSLKSVIKKRKR